MTALLRAELIKLRTTRTFAALIGSALGLSLLIVVLASLLSKDLTEQDVRQLFTSDFTGLFILLLGVMGMAGEWRHRTITSSVLAAPRRTRLLAAKTLSYATAGAVVSFVVTVTIMVAGTVILGARGEVTIGSAELADVLWRNLVVAALFGAMGVLVGALVRNQVAAIVGLLLFTLAIEPAINGLFPRVGKYGPVGGAPNAIIGFNTFESGEILTAVQGLAVMMAWIGTAFVLAAQTLRRRDLV